MSENDPSARRTAARYARTPSVWPAPNPIPQPDRRRGRRWAGHLRVAAAIVVLVAGPPLLLWVGFGNPVAAATSWWATGPLDGYRSGVGSARGLGVVLIWAGWLGWALIVTLLAGSCATVLAGRRAARWRLPLPLHRMIFGLTGTATVVLAGPATAAIAAGPPAQVVTAPAQPADLTSAGLSPGLTTPPPRFALAAHSFPATVSVAGQEFTVTVKRGDTLWDLADRWLGDPHRWTEIHALNADTYDDHGRMRGGDHIERGWVLKLPDDAITPDGSQPADPPPPTGPDAQPGTSATPPAADPTPSAPASPSPSVEAAGPTAAAGTGTPTPTSPPTPAHPSSAVPPAHHPSAGHSNAPTGVPTPASPPVAELGEQSQPDGNRTGPPGITLGSGSWIDLGLATAITAAIALVWANRRRRYIRRPVSPDLRLDDPDLAPMPPVVTQIRRRLHTGTADTDAGGTDADHGPALTGPAPAADEDPEADPAPNVRPVVPTLTNPVIGWPSAGLGLTGPGAEHAARGFLAAALADTDPDAPPSTVILPATTATALLGVATGTLPGTARLVVTANLADALTRLELQILHRSRLVYAHEADTVAAMRTADPYEEPTPPLLLIAETTSNHERTRIAALLAQGQRLDVHGILLGDWPAGDTVVVDTDGITAPGDSGRHGQHPADVGRFAVLTPTETVAVITTLAEAHTGLPQPPPPIEAASPHQNAVEPTEDEDAVGVVLPLDDAGRVLAALAELGDATAAAIAAHLDLPYPAATAKLVQWEHSGHAETTRTDTGQTHWRLTATGRHVLGTPATKASASTPADPVADCDLQGAVPQTGEVQAPTDDRYAEIGTVLQWPDPETTFTSEPTPSDSGDVKKSGHVDVTVLGEAGIGATGPDRRPRRKALELLVYLAVHDGSATVEAILDDLMPEAPASKAPQRLHTYVSDLRSVMRRIGGPGTYLTHPRQRYTLNPDTVDVDLWRMRAAIRHAHQTSDPRQRIDALQQAVDAYRGPLADDADYEWAESYREAIRQQALDAHLALADTLTGDPAAQARVLEAAIRHSPYSEHLYQQAMQARAALGHPDAIRTLRRALDRALAEIDAEPSDDTITLADELIADLQRPGRRADIETTSGSN